MLLPRNSAELVISPSCAFVLGDGCFPRRGTGSVVGVVMITSVV